jgi:hypothetical protein
MMPSCKGEGVLPSGEGDFQGDPGEGKNDAQRWRCIDELPRDATVEDLQQGCCVQSNVPQDCDCG